MEQYDYIIVGAGTAGCILARRLSENKNNKILLLEAGGSDKHPFVKIPAAFSRLFQTSRDWSFFTTPQSSLLGRPHYMPRAKMLGGCSSINAMILFRPHPEDIQEWHQQGHVRFDWEESLVHLKRAEAMMGLKHMEGKAVPGEGFFVHPLTRNFISACEEYGMDVFNPSTSVEQGVKLFTRNVKRGFRYSVADAYLRTNDCSQCIDVRTHCLVKRLLIDQKKVYGLEYFHHSQERAVLARKEILLCAGSIQSPQILQLSGIGDPAALEPLGIPLMHESKEVGQNFTDHLVCGMAFRLKKGVNSLDGLKFPLPAIKAGLKFITTRSGPLTSNVAEAGAFCGNYGGRPTLQFHFGPAFFVNHGFTDVQPYGMSFGPALLHPASKGYVTLSSANPLDPPVIEPQYFQEHADMETMLEGIKLTKTLSTMPSLSKLIERVEYPDCMPDSDEAFVHHIRQFSETLYHPASTCRMGSDIGAVVNWDFKVQGTEGLRVCDASVFPGQTSSNPQLAIMMLAEMLSSILKEQKT